MPSSSGRRIFRGRRKAVRGLAKDAKEGKEGGEKDARPSGGPVGVRLLVLGCDGVLTDGTVLCGPGGEVLRRFSAYDGYGIECLRNVGVEVAILSGKTSAALMHHARALGVKRIVQGAYDKAKALVALAGQSGTVPAEIGFVGDDIPDLGAIRMAGWSAAPAGARPEVKAAVDHVCEAGGGEGAVREVAELILKSRNAWPPIVEDVRAEG